MVDLGQRSFGSTGKRLSELDDDELRAEAERRRTRRKEGSPAAEPRREAASPNERAPSPTPKQVRKWYANLEVREGADLATVEQAYERLIRRYDPDRHRDDPERHQAALALSRSLTRAYRGLVAHLGRRH